MKRQYEKEYLYMFFSTLKDIIQAQCKTNHWVSYNFIIICLKRISEECFSFNVNVNTSLKFLWALRALSEGNQALGHSEDTWALRHLESTRRALQHLRHSGTQNLRSLGHLGHLGHLGTQALGHLGHLGHSRDLGTRGTLFTRLISCLVFNC